MLLLLTPNRRTGCADMWIQASPDKANNSADDAAAVTRLPIMHSSARISLVSWQSKHERELQRIENNLRRAILDNASRASFDANIDWAAFFRRIRHTIYSASSSHVRLRRSHHAAHGKQQQQQLLQHAQQLHGLESHEENEDDRYQIATDSEFVDLILDTFSVTQSGQLFQRTT